MAERATPSVSSSQTDTESYDEKTGRKASSEASSYMHMKEPDEMDIGDLGDDVERMELLPPSESAPANPAPDNSARSAVIWMVVNTLATIGIVSTPCFAVGCRANLPHRSLRTRLSSQTRPSSWHNLLLRPSISS